MRSKEPISVTHPELAKEAVGWDPSTVTAGSNKIVLFRCPLGHEALCRIADRASKSQDCPVCAGRRVIVGINDLLSMSPLIAAQADGWDPTKIYFNSHKSLNWKCELGHTWVAEVRRRVVGNNCPYCSGNKVLEGFNDFASLFPQIAAEAEDFDPKKFTKGSNHKGLWKCKQNHKWRTRIADRVAGNNCPYCSGRIIDVGKTDLATTHPQLVSEAQGLNLTTLSKGTTKIVSWKCVNGHTWQASPNSRTNGNTNCPYCSGNKVLTGFNDLLTIFPDIAAQADGWDPSQISSGSNSHKSWKCSSGHIWSAKVSMRARGTGCPFCVGRKIWIGFNDLVTTHPELAAQADGWDPFKYSSGSHGRKKWKCNVGHSWSVSINARTNSESGCPSCSTSGFNPNAEGWVYFLIHNQWQMLQIGITNFPNQRLKNHKKLGWELIELRGPMDGLIARQWETSILQMLRRHGAKIATEEVAGKFDGYTESWLRESMPVNSLKELMDLVYQDENSG